MAVVCLSFLFLLLAGEGFSQCFTGIGCNGSLVPAESAVQGQMRVCRTALVALVICV